MLKYEGTDKIRDIKYEDGYVDKIYYDNNTLLVFTSDKEKTGVDEVLFKGRKLVDVTSYGKCEQTNLPLGYTKLEYIESTGTQYIDTDILLSNTDVFEISFQSLNSLETPIMGAISGGTSYASTGNLSVTYILASGLSAYSVYCDGAAGNPNYSWNGGNRADGLKHTIKYNGLNIAPTLDGVSMTQTGTHTLTENTPTVTTWLFGRNNTSTGTLSQNGIRIYNVNIQGKGHFIPAKRNSDDVIGMYDTVSGQFFTNQGTGTFIAGPDVVPTPDKPIDIWCNNGVIKARHQSGLPLGYTLLDYIESSGTQYIDTGIEPTNDITLKVVFTFTGDTSSSRRVFGKILGSVTLALNYREVGSSFYWFSSINNSSIIPDKQKHTIEFRTDEKVYRDNVEIGAKSTFGGSGNYSMYLFAERTDNNAINYGQVKIYEWEVYSQGVLIQKFVPAKNSNDVIGMYDTVTNTFFTNAGTGDFIAGNEVSDPVEIYTDGTVETINVHGKNLLNPVNIHQGTLDGISGAVFNVPNRCYFDFIKVKAGDTIYCSTKNNTPPFFQKIFTYSEPNEESYVGLLGSTAFSFGDYSGYKYTVRADQYVHGLLLQNANFTPSDVIDAQVTINNEPTTYEPYYNGGTATAEMLLKVGDYQDEQEILSGAITRNVGIKVLDGTENWNWAGTSVWRARLVITTIPLDQRKTPPLVCNMFVAHSWNSPVATQPQISIVSDGTTINFTIGWNTDITTLAGWKQFLADQYAAGTPVIVVYPLAESTTEQVTGQTLTIQQGNNTVEVTQASVDDILLKVKYK